MSDKLGIAEMGQDRPEPADDAILPGGGLLGGASLRSRPPSFLDTLEREQLWRLTCTPVNPDTCH